MRLLLQTIASITCGIRYSATMHQFNKAHSQPSGGSYGGRGSYNDANKQRYLNMSTAEKRKIYLVSRFFELSQIPSWSTYKPKNRSSKKLEAKVLPDEELNEKVSLFKGNITELEIDAVVNAANARLAGGGGVDGAIHDAANWDFLQAECRTLGGCPTGQAKATGGYCLPARYIIHTVGPQDADQEALRRCYVNSLAVAREIGARTVAFPCISTGIYGFPNDRAARIAVAAVREELEKDKSKAESDQFKRIIFCVFLDKDMDLYEQYLPVYFPRGTPITKDINRGSKQTNAKASASNASGSPAANDEIAAAANKDTANPFSMRSISQMAAVSKPEEVDKKHPLPADGHNTDQGANGSDATTGRSEITTDGSETAKGGNVAATGGVESAASGSGAAEGETEAATARSGSAAKNQADPANKQHQKGAVKSKRSKRKR